MISILLALIVGTWNGNWFPSGRAEHRAPEAKEAATIAGAGRMLADGLSAVDPSGTNDVIFIFNEIRNREVADRLVAAIGRKGLRVVSISAYRRRDRFDQQQDVIATTLPVVDTHWARWAYDPKANPPRGFAFASVVVAPAVTSHVYAVHLKSNYGARDEVEAEANRARRASAIRQFLVREKSGPFVILAGDLNADRWAKEFERETIFDSLEKGGFLNVIAEIPAAQRITHPHYKFGGNALDYVMVRGFESLGRARILPKEKFSDHCAVFTEIVPCSRR